MKDFSPNKFYRFSQIQYSLVSNDTVSDTDELITSNNLKNLVNANNNYELASVKFSLFKYPNYLGGFLTHFKVNFDLSEDTIKLKVNKVNLNGFNVQLAYKVIYNKYNFKIQFFCRLLSEEINPVVGLYIYERENENPINSIYQDYFRFYYSNSENIFFKNSSSYYDEANDNLILLN